MKKLTLIWFILFCFCSVLVSAEDSGNKTAVLTLSPNLEKTLYLNTKYASLFKVEIKNKSPCSPKDTITVSYNVSKDGIIIKEDYFSKEIGCTTSASTGEFIPAEIGNYALCGTITNSSVAGNYPSSISCTNFEAISTASISCDISLNLKTNETIFYENSQSIEFKPELNNASFPFVIEYWIEDLFGNIVKPKINTTNTNQKSWKTNIQEQDRVLFLKAIVYPACDDLDSSNNAVEKMFIVTKDEAEGSLSSTEEDLHINSTINITKISESVYFGSILDVEIEIYKGITDRYSISVWAEKDGKVISEKSKIHLKTKNTLYQFMLPVQLEANCDKKIEDGPAQLIVEGLSLHAEKEFSLQGINKKLCPGETETSGSEKSERSFQIIGLPAEISPGEVLRINFELKNNEDEEFESWSYLYRGSKCYSCAEGERDENKIFFSVDAGETKPVKMLVKADQGLEGGEYNLMVKYKKEGQKTEHSISEKIMVRETAEKAKVTDQTLLLLSKPENAASPLISEKTQKKEISSHGGIVVYESVSEKSKKLISWVLLIAFGLLSLTLILKGGNT